MTTIQNSSEANAEEILKNENTPNGVQSPTVPEEDYKSLQAFATRTRQFAIKTAIDAVEANPNYIASIDDKSIQDAVVKHKYGFDNYAQLVAVMWENFSQSNSQDGGNDDENAPTKLEKEVRLLKYQQEVTQIDNAINEYKMSNPHMFTEEGAEQKLRDELVNISTNLPVKERIRRSAQIALVPTVDPSNVAFAALNLGRTPTNSGNPNPKVDAKELEKQKQIEAGRKLFGLNKK